MQSSEKQKNAIENTKNLELMNMDYVFRNLQFKLEIKKRVSCLIKNTSGS